MFYLTVVALVGGCRWLGYYTCCRGLIVCFWICDWMLSVADFVGFICWFTWVCLFCDLFLRFHLWFNLVVWWDCLVCRVYLGLVYGL